MDRLQLLADLLRKPTGLLGDRQQSIPVGSLLNPATVNPLMARKVEAQRQTMPIANALTRYNESYPQSWGEFGENVKQAFPTPASGGTREQILAAAQNLAMGIGPQATVFHGSPYRFDKFDASKIGSGEGAQAYGHGLYFAENPKVAQEYSKMQPSSLVPPNRIFQGRELTPGTPEYHAGTLLERSTLLAARKEVSRWIAEGSPDPKVLDGWRKTLDTLNAAKSKADFKVGSNANLYKVDLPDEHIAKMLDWDKPLSQQPKAVQDYFGKVDPNGRVNLGLAYTRMMESTGKTQPQIAEELRQMGIPGIRYLDGGSRAGGQGTSNFVVFPGNEGLLKILERQ